jgi:predicted enzyme related to lactoylglutathione lyase
VSGVGWVTAFIDTAEDRADDAEVFWSRVSGQRVSQRRGARDEFASLLPAEGDPYLKVQRVGQSPPGGLHLDLHSDDVRGLAARAEDLGASASYLDAGYVVCGSPGGMTFCVVGHPASRPAAPSTWPGGRSMVDQVCLDIPPSRFDEECSFWEALTGWELSGFADDSEFRRLAWPDDIPVRFLLQRLDDEQSVVTAHLDLSSDDADAEAERHAALGASVVRRTEGWITLTDPTGRSYCVTRRTPRDR